MKITLFNGRPVGEVEDGVFRKRIKGSKHLLRVPPAIAYDSDVLDKAERAGAEMAEVYDEESGKTYRADLRTIREKGIRVNRGFGEQIALMIKDWLVK